MVTAPVCLFRPAFPDEVARARHVFPGAPSDTVAPPAWFLAVKEAPVERIVGALWWRRLPRAGCVEFDWRGTAALADEGVVGLFSAWRVALAATSAGPERLRLFGWRSPEYPFASLAGKLRAAVEWERRELLSAKIEDLSARPPAGAEGIRGVEPADLPALRRLVEARSLFELHEWLDAAKAAGGAAPTLFDPRVSVALRAGDEIVGACLANHAGAVVRVSALVADAAADRAGLLRETLARARRHSPEVERVLFDCPVAPEDRSGWALVSAGELLRASFVFPSP